MVECGFCVCLTNLFRFIISYSCTFPALPFWHSDLILPWLECLGVVVSGSQSCGWWWGRRSSLLFYPILQLFLVLSKGLCGWRAAWLTAWWWALRWTALVRAHHSSILFYSIAERTLCHLLFRYDFRHLATIAVQEGSLQKLHYAI